MSTAATRAVIIERILADMPRKYQNGKLQIRSNVARKYYYVRVTIPKITESGERRPIREAKVLGFCDEISLKEAKKRRAELLEVVNAPKVVATSAASFRGIVERFLNVRVPQLGIAAQAKYASQIRKGRERNSDSVRCTMGLVGFAEQA